jgi:hypothetical protein
MKLSALSLFNFSRGDASEPHCPVARPVSRNVMGFRSLKGHIVLVEPHINQLNTTVSRRELSARSVKNR